MQDALDFDQLVLLACGHTAFHLLWAGVQLGVFDELAKTQNLTRDEIAQRIGLQSQPARILMTGLAALRLVQKEGERFRNAPIVERLLTRASPENMIDVLGWQRYIVYPALVDFVDSLKQFKNVGLRHFKGDADNIYQRLQHDPFIAKVFHDAMSSLSSAANKALATLEVFDHITHMVDAGGGDGTNAIALVQAHPRLKITIFDNQVACDKAKVKVEQAGLAANIFTHAGDFFVDPFPTGIDAVFFGHMMPIWSHARDTALLKKAYDALPPGGKVIIFNMMGDDDEVGPMSAALGSPYFLTVATGEGMMYSWREHEQHMIDAGFTPTERHVLPKDHGVLVGVK
ncbi:MAG: methyltransferase [Burkholderiales bacterium]|nr:methyltransferase [Burkholderiales bacterium]